MTCRMMEIDKASWLGKRGRRKIKEEKMRREEEKRREEKKMSSSASLVSNFFPFLFPRHHLVHHAHPPSS